MFKQATVDAASVPSTQSNFPTYIDLSRLGITTLAEAQSVRVYADSGKTTEWAREIVSLTEMHVKVPSLTSTVDIYIDADGIRADYAVGATYGRNAVWAGFRVVYHMNDVLTDSTGNGHNLTNNGGTFENGLFGRGMRFSGGQYARTPASMMTNVGSVSTFYKDNAPASSGMLWGCSNVGIKDFNRVWLTANNYTPLIENNQFSVPANSSSNWSHTVQSWDTLTAWENFYNGTLAVTGTAVKNPTTTIRTMLGALGGNTLFTGLPLYFDGVIAEWRVSLTRQSLNWTLTEYNNQDDEATFWGTWTTVSGGSPAQAARRGVIMMM